MQITHASIRPRTRGPFQAVASSVALAILYAVAALVWAVAGDLLPGGRWLVVHLFTLGILTNLIVGFTQHFGRTLSRADGDDATWPTLALNAGIVVLLVGIITGATIATAIGGTVVTAIVCERYLNLRRMRRGAVGARFGWIVRCYERAHGAFVHGAILGLLLGTGVLGGAWYWSGRMAHLHVNVLGWAGLTLLATLVFFGPTVVRRQIEQGADARAARVLRRGATGLTVGVLLLLASGVGGAWGDLLRVGGAAGLAVFAIATGVVCAPIARVARTSDVSATRWGVLALCAWFPLVVWADVFVVATGRWQYLDALGIGIGLGVLVQAIVVTLSHVAPLLIAREYGNRVRSALERGGGTRAVLHNGGTALVLVSVLAAVDGSVAIAGWTLVGAGLAQPVVVALLPSVRDG
ncbi:MAG: hypothetical protein R3320_11175 [Nitriliruptorales bacterium]|nr:hypothetical protein [Nitriliruptorales bacterium]